MPQVELKIIISKVILKTNRIVSTNNKVLLDISFNRTPDGIELQVKQNKSTNNKDIVVMVY